MKIDKSSVILGAIALYLTSCGVPSAQAPRENVVPIALKTFPKKNWRLANNRFFLWKENVTSEQISRAQAVGRDVDDYDGKAMPLNAQHLALEDKINQLGNQKKPSKVSADKMKAQFAAIAKEMTATQTALTASQKLIDDENKKPNPDAAVITQNRIKIAELSGKLSALKTNCDWVKSEQDRLDKELKAVDTKLTPLQTQLTDLEARQNAIEVASRARIDELIANVDWFSDQPSAVSFHFDDTGSISALISNWGVSDSEAPRTFSTKSVNHKKPTMGKVTYTELGGIFEFEVYVYDDEDQTKLRETYAFRIGRIKYDNSDGRNFFGGEIVRTRTLANGTVETRKGYAKLCDSNN